MVHMDHNLIRVNRLVRMAIRVGREKRDCGQPGCRSIDGQNLWLGFCTDLYRVIGTDTPDQGKDLLKERFILIATNVCSFIVKAGGGERLP